MEGIVHKMGYKGGHNESRQKWTEERSMLKSALTWTGIEEKTKACVILSNSLFI